MSEFIPLRAQDITPERALAMAPCLDLDLFVFSRVVEVPDDILRSGNLGAVPGYSRVFGSSYMLLIKVMNEIGPMFIEMGPQFFDEAVRKGYMVRKTQCPVWKISSGNVFGYGRNFEEALCKLLIAHKFMRE